jgi:hypothetical protein
MGRCKVAHHLPEHILKDPWVERTYEPITSYRQWPAERVICEYLAEARGSSSVSHTSMQTGRGLPAEPANSAPRNQCSEPADDAYARLRLICPRRQIRWLAYEA